MTWVAGQSGNPAGRKPVERSMAGIMRRLLNEVDVIDNNGRTITKEERICEKLIEGAIDGQLEFIKLVFYYTLGRPATTIELHQVTAPDVEQQAGAARELIRKLRSDPEAMKAMSLLNRKRKALETSTTGGNGRGNGRDNGKRRK